MLGGRRPFRAVTVSDAVGAAASQFKLSVSAAPSQTRTLSRCQASGRRIVGPRRSKEKPNPRRWDFRSPVLRAARKRPAQTLRISRNPAAVVRRCPGSGERAGPPSTQRALRLGAAESRAGSGPAPASPADPERHCRIEAKVPRQALSCGYCGVALQLLRHPAAYKRHGAGVAPVRACPCGD